LTERSLYNQIVPRTPEQNSQLRLATRSRLLDAALHQFALQGFAATSIRDIALQANVATGLLYSHFPSKDALLSALFERGLADVQSSIAQADTAAQPLAALIRGAAAIVRAHLPFWRLFYSVRSQPAALAALGPLLNTYTAAIRANLERHLSPIDAYALFTQIDGLCEHFALYQPDLPLDQVVESIIVRWTHPS
jgi:AcrR family transcriptional regulator